jgi:hypothetical protein
MTWYFIIQLYSGQGQDTGWTPEYFAGNEDYNEKSLGERKDILSYLINGTDLEIGTAFTTVDAITEANVLPIAGGDTMGIALCGTFSIANLGRV